MLYIVSLLVKPWQRAALYNQFDKTFRKFYILICLLKFCALRIGLILLKLGKLGKIEFCIHGYFQCIFYCLGWVHTLQNVDWPADHIIKDQSYTNIENEFIVLLIRILPANIVFTNCSSRHSVYVWLSMHSYWKIYVFKFGRIEIWDLLFECMTIHSLLLVTLLKYVTHSSFHWLKKIWIIKIRRGFCGHSVFFLLYLLFIVPVYF
jgi:hypothetical protein